MRERRLGIGKRQAGLQRGNRHAFAQLQVTRMLQQSGKRIDDAACRRSCKAGGDRIAIDVPDRFQCMRQRVKSGCREYLLPAAVSQMVAHGVTSLPVPAVVGMAIRVLAPIPDSGAASRKCESNSSKRPEGVLLSMALAQSITLPPPKATMQSTSA